jgi:flagellar hook-associated protein 1 FlgK
MQQVSAGAVREGNLIKGFGVRADGIVQIVDKALVERMYNAQTSLSGSQTLDRAYSQLEELTTDLDNSGLNRQFSLFNNALLELSAQPNDTSLRDFVVLQGETLAKNIRQTRDDAVERRELWNGELDDISNQINRLTERIAKLNLEIATIEGGGLLRSDATGLRDQRYTDLEELSKLVNIYVQEQENGTVSVFVGGDYLISNGVRREVYTAYDPDREGNEVRIIETDSPLQSSSGRLAAAITARDQIFGDYIDNLDNVATALIRGVNEVHSQGQGRRGHSDVLSSVAVASGVPLADAGFPWAPRNGSFDIKIVDLEGQTISEHRISVRALGQVTDSTIDSIAAEINAIDGVTASITSGGRLEILSDSPTAEFTFAEDTSGFLAAIGVNTFFTGEAAYDISVNAALTADSGLLAVSRGGVGSDTDVLTDLVDLVDRPLQHLSGESVRMMYEDSVASLAQKINIQSSATEGLRNLHATLQSQHLAISGVNIDEESIKMIGYQRAFQASSRVIATANEMLEILVAL